MSVGSVLQRAENGPLPAYAVGTLFLPGAVTAKNAKSAKEREPLFFLLGSLFAFFAVETHPDQPRLKPTTLDAGCRKTRRRFFWCPPAPTSDN
jgi:hypothetical protein